MSLLKAKDRAAGQAREWPMAFWPSWRWFDETFRDFDGQQLIKVEEFAEEGNLVVRAEMPGIDPDKDVDISVRDGMLHITAERSEEEEKTEREFHRRELRYGSFARSLPLPDGADETSVKATYKDGILEVRVPVAATSPKETARKIPISRG